MLHHELALKLWLLLLGPAHTRPHRPLHEAITMEHRELAQAIRRLPQQYHGRIPGPRLRRITHAASSGRWEKAVADLIAYLRAHDQPVTAEERDQLRAAMGALGLPTEQLHHLHVQG
jgi:hypothetical protein